MDARIDLKTELILGDETRVEKLARQRISEDGLYSFYFRDISCSFDGGVLTLLGRVPTFYLKQVLQTMLVGVDGIDRLDNRVEVVNSTGLSSVRSDSALDGQPIRRLAPK